MTPLELYYQTQAAGYAEIKTRYTAEIAACDANGGKLPTPAKVSVAALDAERTKAENEQASLPISWQHMLDARLAELAYQKRYSESKPSADDLRRNAAEQVAYAKRMAEQRAWLVVRKG